MLAREMVGQRIAGDGSRGFRWRKHGRAWVRTVALFVAVCNGVRVGLFGSEKLAPELAPDSSGTGENYEGRWLERAALTY